MRGTSYRTVRVGLPSCICAIRATPQHLYSYADNIHGMLASFLRYLGEKGLIDVGAVGSEDDVGFDTEFKVQKYMHIAQNLGLGTGYEYAQYSGGPHSPQLMEEYWDIGGQSVSSAGPLPDSFARDDFVMTVSGRDAQWLEVATILINLSRHYTHRTELLKHMTSMAPWYSEPYVDGVLQDIAASPLGKAIPYLQAVLSSRRSAQPTLQ